MSERLIGDPSGSLTYLVSETGRRRALESAPVAHEHFTCLERARGAMDPVVACSAARWERLEKRFEDASAALQEHEQAVDSRLNSLEDFAYS